MAVSSPRASRLALPRWLNVRLGAGVLLVLLSTLLGARIVAAADVTETVWAARRDLPPGYRLGSSDLTAVQVRLGSASQPYIAASTPIPDGYVLGRRVSAGELLPRSALVTATAVVPDRRVVAVPVQVGHWPHDLAPGDVVDVYATPKSDSRADPPSSRLVMSAVPVQSVPHAAGGVFGGSDGGSAVELSVPTAAVASLVLSVETCDIDLVEADPSATDGTRVGGAGSGSPSLQPGPSAASGSAGEPRSSPSGDAGRPASRAPGAGAGQASPANAQPRSRAPGKTP